ncbi:MAG TPA: hypothetical protein VN238_09930 [Solirubrobacteraceae bacterium]|nr:hypothetical protein [Solirubrobacteraceae bacterium]
MSLPDRLAIFGGALSLVGAMLGLSTNPGPDREWLDHGQRGAFVGVVFGAFMAFAAAGALVALGEPPW